jgi:hypothetical protein
MSTTRPGKRHYKYYFTLEDIEELTTVPCNTIRQHILREKFNPEKFKQVFNYIRDMRQQKGIRT